MIPLKLKKEQPGYLLNSLLVPLLDATMTLKALDIAETSKISTTLGDTEQVLHLDLSKY